MIKLNNKFSDSVATTPAPGGSNTSGEIQHLNYNINENLDWPISSDCDSVRVWSTQFSTEERYDYLTINSQDYSGETTIDTIVPYRSFTIRWHSDGSQTKTGFILNWACSTISD